MRGFRGDADRGIDRGDGYRFRPLENLTLEGGSYPGLTFRGCKFVGCRLSGCSLERAA